MLSTVLSLSQSSLQENDSYLRGFDLLAAPVVQVIPKRTQPKQLKRLKQTQLKQPKQPKSTQTITTPTTQTTTTQTTQTAQTNTTKADTTQKKLKQ